MDAAPIRFLFDFVSPYSYLAWTQIHALASQHGRSVEPVAVVFGAILSARGHKGPAEIEPKRLYILADVTRSAAALGVPFALPPTHPFNPLVALRVASAPGDHDARRALIDALYAAAWGRGCSIESPTDVARVLDDAGLEGDRRVADATTDARKAQLRTQTDQAIAAGAFGVPTMLVDGALFWGLDSLPHLARHLRGDDPITPDHLARFEALRPSAIRRA
jgi:2-hydroxychromene-2-carboxylate isomerase